jgi:hypothetical protein
MSDDLYRVRTCKTWRGYSVAEIVGSATLVKVGAGSTEIAPTLPNLNAGTVDVSGYLLHLTEDDMMLIESCYGTECQMDLTTEQADKLRALTAQAEELMMADYGPRN